MLAKCLSRALAVLLILPSAAFALGLGDIRLLSPLNAPLDAEIELVDVTPEELNSLQAQIASRDTFSRYGLDWPTALSTVTVRTVRTPDGRQVVKLKSNDAITEPFLTVLVEVTWAHGRLVREYTMLLDPPVYTPGQSAASNAPVSGPSAGTGTREGSISRASQLPPPSGATSGISASAESAPANAAPAAGEAKPAPVARTTAAGATRVVKRGDTLSRIASEVSGTGSDSAQARSWMLAIYQANPHAFEQNMNVLHSGAVLRIPDASEAATVSPTAALSEIRRQFVAWRASTPAAGASAGSQAGRLRLVTPSEPASAGTGGPPSNEVKSLQGRVHDLESQLSESKRLLEMRNAELAQMQARLAGQKAPPAASPPTPQAAPAAPAEPPPSAQAQPPSAAPAPAETPPAQAAPPAEPPAAASPPPAPIKKPTPAANAPEAGGGFLDTLKGLWWVAALLVLALVGLMGVRFWRSRRESEFDDSLGRLAAAGATTAERGFASGDTAPMRAIPSTAAETAFVVEETGTHERPRLEPAPAAAAPRHVSTDQTISSETAINLDQGDPLAEADFHMAYGLYDQAADLIRISIAREPERRDLKLKLLEVFFVWGNKEQFLQAAHELAGTRAEAAPGEWEKILIMGKQLAPDDVLFSGAAAVSGATAGGVDLDLEGGQQRVDFDLVGEPGTGQAMPGVDLDFGSALGDFESTAESPAHGSDRTATTRQMTAKLTQDTAMLTPDFGADAEAPTVEQPGLAARETPTIRQKVEMALKQGGSGVEQTAELAIDDLGLDLGALDTVDQPGLGASAEGPTLVAGLDDDSREVMQQARRRASPEEPVSGTGTWKLDAGDLEEALAQRHAEAENGRDATSQTARLDALDLHTSTMDAQKIDFDLGESDVAHAGNGSGLDLDLGGVTTPDAAFTSTQKLSADDLALPDIEPVTMSEVGTKLDLARAYMDMGDPDGARNILEEVLHEGSVAQKQEAQRLMESLPG